MNVEHTPIPKEWIKAAGDAVHAMRWWAAQEDGIPEEVAPAFMALHFLLGWSVSCKEDQQALTTLLEREK